MSEENKAIARRWMEALWSQGNSSVADEIIAPNYAVHDPGTPGRVGGIEGEKHTVTMYRTVFPDLRFTIEDEVGEGDGPWSAGLPVAPIGRVDGPSPYREANGGDGD